MPPDWVLQYQHGNSGGKLLDVTQDVEDGGGGYTAVSDYPPPGLCHVGGSDGGRGVNGGAFGGRCPVTNVPGWTSFSPWVLDARARVLLLLALPFGSRGMAGVM